MPDGKDSSPPDAASSCPDSVDALLASWAKARPDLDMGPVAVVSRLQRVRAHLDRELESVFEDFGLSAPSFAVLVTLSRIAGEGGVSQRRLADQLGLTPGTVSVRIDQLVRQGLVERTADPDSKRRVQVALTAKGRDLFEEVVPVHLANEGRLLAALTAEERDLLAGLLRKLLTEFEGTCTSSEQRLGLLVEPAHVTMRMRQAVGLSPVDGLLVRAAERGYPAARAGVLPGDVLISAGRVRLRSSAALNAAIDASSGSRLKLTILRGTEKRQINVSLDARPEHQEAVPPPSSTRGRHAV
jgi:DNA-binding MarR family transcriptional regulator